MSEDECRAEPRIEKGVASGKGASDGGTSTDRRVPLVEIATLRIASLTDVAVLAGAAGGALFFYNRVYSSVFLPAFGLGVGVVPMSMQDAVVDGLGGFVLNIFYLWLPVVAFLAAVFASATLLRFLGLDEPRRRPSYRISNPRLAAAVQRVRTDPLGPSRVKILLFAIALPMMLVASVVVLEISAELAARRSVRGFVDSVTGHCISCATYELAGRRITGRPIGSTADRLFVLSADLSVTPVRLDDVKSIALPEATAPRGLPGPKP